MLVPYYGIDLLRLLQIVIISGPLGLYGLFTLIFVLIISVLAFSYWRLNSGLKVSKIDLVNLVLIIITVVSGSGLIVDVPALQSAGFLHWVVLLAYVSILIIASCARYLGKIKSALPVIAAFSALMFALMLIDLFGNLPLSDYYNALPNFGMKYLLGFGAPGTASMFSVSLAFVLLLITSVVQAAISLIIWIKIRKSKKIN